MRAPLNSAVPGRSRPNILFISTHDINPHLGCYAGAWPGAEQAITPNLDRLAAEGIRYDNAFATAPVCAPSRSSIMTGCFPTAIGTMHMRTKAVPPPDVKLFPELLRAVGYYTLNNFFTDFQVHTPPTTFDDCSPTAHWRNRPCADTPFFAAFHSAITHESQLYLDDAAFAAATAHVRPEDRHHPDSVDIPPYHPDTDIFRAAWARYLDLITEMDHWVGELLEQLTEDRLAEDTIVVFWSDHGLGMPRGKRWVNESGLHVPLIVRWPGAPTSGQARCELVHLMDLAPTLLQACGVTLPPTMHGKPFLTAEGAPLAPNDYVFAGRDRMDEQEDTSRSVRDERFRYIRHLHPDRSGMGHCDYPDQLPTWRELRRLAFEESLQLACGEFPGRMTELQRSLTAATKSNEELYDLLADPHETNNLATDPSMETTLKRMRDTLDQWTGSYGDLGQLPENELIERWCPDGTPHRTEKPHVVESHGSLHMTCPTPGASIGWTTDPPATQTSDPDLSTQITGAPPIDDRRWHLYTEPLRTNAKTAIWVAAWRLGYAPSEEVIATSLQRTDPSEPFGKLV